MIIISLLHHYYLIITSLLHHFYVHCYYIITTYYYVFYIIILRIITLLLHHCYIIITNGKSCNNDSIITCYAKSMPLLLHYYYVFLRHYYTWFYYYPLVPISVSRTCRWRLFGSASQTSKSILPKEEQDEDTAWERLVELRVVTVLMFMLGLLSPPSSLDHWLLEKSWWHNRCKQMLCMAERDRRSQIVLNACWKVAICSKSPDSNLCAIQYSVHIEKTQVGLFIQSAWQSEHYSITQLYIVVSSS